MQKKLINPASLVFSWFSEVGKWGFVDTLANRTVLCHHPMHIMVLEVLHTLRGYSHQHQSGLYANEVRSLKHQVLCVKASNGSEIACGLYHDIKPLITKSGAEYYKSVYAILFNRMLEPGYAQIINIRMNDLALKSWQKAAIIPGRNIIVLKPAKDHAAIETRDDFYYKPQIIKKGSRDDLYVATRPQQEKLKAYFTEYFKPAKPEPMHALEAGLESQTFLEKDKTS